MAEQDSGKLSSSSRESASASSQANDTTSPSAKNYTISIQDVTWTPLVNHTTENDHAVYVLKDCTESLAAAHSHLGGNGAKAISSLRDKDREIANSLGSAFDIDDELQTVASPTPSAKRFLFF